MKLDRSNRAYSLLRYFLVLSTKDFEEIFDLKKHSQHLRQIIYLYFNPPEKEKKKKNVQLISTEVFSSYIEINFQGTPTLNLSEFIGVLKSTSARKFLQEFPESRTGKGLWSNDYLIFTREQFVKAHKDFYFASQKKK
uniref:Transposase IS200 like protein n=1 Tax=Promethearchaeum syntrophicum TaxID=2594042 RepID=A0A5B9DF06_9ARCH|nr:transposase [Candidatus Prometheoarchaeum syntrophicum]QEE17714.1 Transposase IS200 like protein [Candidatus Prometheoarchaeum syntrophicum]